ncbi:RNA 2',3'-cyclic phosphodiesterase [Corallincola platygyrae]|uniref:RNA 2',3'-cyclic phosphodiesterase n=1 Tax=Corallincola platygyrae TaxID=1193278 RepID=A0ABW4XMN5_9GAMM
MTKNGKRLFLGLGFNTEAKNQIAENQRSLAIAGRPVAAANFHQTLVFLGQVSEEQQSQLVERVNEIENPAFAITYNRFGYWRKPQILFLAPTSMPEELSKLVEQLQQAVIGAGLPIEERPYRPHITLVRKVTRQPQTLPAPIAFSTQFQQFTLYHSASSADGVCYLPLQTWPLQI